MICVNTAECNLPNVYRAASTSHTVVRCSILLLVWSINLLTGSLNCADAQQLFSPGGDHFVKTTKVIVDTANIVVFYDLKYLNDSTKTSEYTSAQTVLMISDAHTLFGDYRRIMFDSINDCMATNKKHARNKDMRKQWLQLLDSWTYNVVALNNLNTEQSTVQIYDKLRSYEYTTPTPDLSWQLLSNDSVINELPCKKATCNYAGRKYIAWYAESIPMPYGPYLFGGLPGLIIKLHDTKKHWVFTHTSMGKPTANKQIYIYGDKFILPIIKTSREKALEAYRNDVENYRNLSVEVFNVKVKKNGQWVTPETNYPTRSSNHLELEW